MLIINPTYSALPVSLHRKLTFLFFSLPLPLSPFPLTTLPFFSPPLLQQTYSRENYWRWGVWEKQELLPGAGRASHGRHESAERCSTEPISFSFLSVSRSRTLSVSFSPTVSGLRLSPGPSVSSLSTPFTSNFTLLYLLHGNGTPFTPCHPPLLLLCTQEPFYFSYYTTKTPAKSNHKYTFPNIMTVSPDCVVICIKRERRV